MEFSLSNSQEWYPHYAFQQSPHEVLVAEPVLQERVTQISDTEEHDSRGQPDLEAVHVETINRKLKSEQKVVQK